MPPATPFLLAALVVIVWLDVRIGILRRHAASGSTRPPVRAWGWLAALAAKPWIRPVLGVLALLLAVAVAWTYGVFA